MKEYTFHPACLAWPEMDEAALKDLAESIKANGQREPIKVWRGQIVDGRNRVLACKLAGKEPVFEEFSKNRFADDAEVWTYTCDLNAHRRHLTREQLRFVIDAHLKATPERSNRQIAKELSVSHTTVAERREQAERRGQIGHVETVTDTKGRQQPARRPSSPPKAEPQSEPPAVEPEDAPEDEPAGAKMEKAPEDEPDEVKTEAPQEPPTRNERPPRLPGQEFDVECRLVRDAVACMAQATVLLRQCEAKYGFGERSVARLREAHSALCGAMKGVVA